MNQSTLFQMPTGGARATAPRPAAELSGLGQAQLTNMGLALRTLMDCMDAGSQSPRLGVLYGYSGYGKSVGAAFAAARTNAAYVCARSVWSQRTLLEQIAQALGIVKLAKTAPAILEQIIDQLTYFARPLVIDEMDFLVKRQSVEIIRDIHDATSIAIMMIGEEALPAKLKEWERFDNRIRIATAAQPASDEDTLKLRDHYCLRVRIADDLALRFKQACKGCTRRIVNNLMEAQTIALASGRDQIDLAWWGSKPIMTGDLQTRRFQG
ncbi:AAA family ATPase [Blastomonas sp. AAP25]|uniref:AAA family ATPase n=1 Tax=Blastomonas sp. AAP25 TaxID=1523416 RepID=UPI000AD8DCDA|nr:ATP-binding protein [Blastomonas sp. AAP25]